ncbi:uncharacterized protein [Drosophila bipectinata]|uniref:uncharacterized protein n=1 Tax=Drosophila bipectinata TaxID=42026 RepID=UPI001C8981FC|nr:uncharacterized protein LOC108132924 [Drosophila bipectinata]
MFRVQKVLLAEYQEIYEPVLVENPFTMVDSRGVGLRQYHIGLTCNRLLFGCDIFRKCGDKADFLSYGVDPEIECFDLVSMFPLQFLRFHFYRKNKRSLMMLSVIQPVDRCPIPTANPMIFEFGGGGYTKHFWYTWRERVSAIRFSQPRYGQITGASPFSSTDIQLDDEPTVAQVHPPPRTPSVFSKCHAGV